jgi:hypothetical protein
MYRSFRYSFLFIISIILSSSPLYAGNTIEKLPRTSASTPTASIDWSVTNGAGQCNGTTDYPNSGDGFRSWWETGVHATQGTSALYPIHAEPGTYTFTCTDSSYSSYSDTSYLVVKPCSDHGPGYSWNGSSCVNPAPSVSISPTGTQGLDISSSVTYSSTANDTGNDLTAHNFDWQTPSGAWSWQNGNAGGTTDVVPQSSFGGKSTNSRTVVFTPTVAGDYLIDFAALDNNNTRWTPSAYYTLTVCDADHRWIAGWCQPIVKISSFTYTPSAAPDVDRSESAVLSWNSQAATSCALNGGQYSATNVGTNGSVTTTTLTTDTTYTLTCQGLEGPASSTLTVLVATGSISSTLDKCFIGVGGTSCPIKLSWTSSNMSSPQVSSPLDGVISSSSSAFDLSQSITYGSRTFSLKNNTYTHGSVAVSADCVSGTTFDGDSCEPANSDPIGNFEGGSCAVTGWTCDPDNYNIPIYVDLGVGSTTIGTTLANITRDTSIGAQCGGNRVHGFSFSMPTQYQNGIPVTVNATAINTPSGNSPNLGSQNITCLVTAGHLFVTPSSCVIPTGGSTCTVGATWDTSNVATPMLYDGNTGSSTPVNAQQSSAYTIYASFPSTTYSLRNGSTNLDSKTVTATCKGGSQWNTSSCVATTNVTVGPLVATPATVNSGEATTLSWSEVANTTGCTLSGGQFSSTSVGSAPSSSRGTNTLTANTTYTLTCNGLGGPVSSSVTANVATGNISAPTPSCVIGSGQSECAITLSWTTDKMSTPRVTTATNVTLYSTALGSNVQRPIAYGNTTFNLKNGSYTHGSVTVSATCAPLTSFVVGTGRCDPASTVTIGSIASTPGTVNSSQTAVISWSSVTNTTGCTLDGGQFSNESVGTLASGSRTTNALTANTTYTLTCEGSGGPVSSSVTTIVAEGTIHPTTPGVTSCLIQSGSSNCQVSISWESLNMTSPRVTNASNTTISNSANGTLPITVNRGVVTYSLKNGTFIHNSVTLSASCATGLVFKNGICTVGTSSGTLTLGPSCTIATNASTCTVNATWSTTGATAPELIDANVNATTSTNANQATPLSVSVAFPQTIYNLEDGTTILDTKIATAACGGTDVWNYSTSRCTVLASVAIGALVATPSTINYGETTTLSWSGVGNADSCTLNGGQFNNESVGVLTTGTRPTQALTGDVTYTLNCVGHNGPVTATVTVKVASGSISASPSVCVINTNESSCLVGVTWNTLNMNDPRMTDGLNTTLSTNTTGTGVQQQITYGNNTFAIKNGVTTHDSVLANAVCDAASKWNGTVCAPASATINSANCSIPKNAKLCSVSVIWSTINTASTVTVVRPYAGNSIFATGNGNTVSASFPAGQFNLDVKQGSSLLATGTYNATCAAGSVWTVDTCIETTNVTVGLLSATPSTVNYGLPSTLSWNGVANATACTLSGGEFSNTSVGTSETGTQVTSPLTTDTTYTLSCSGPSGPKTSSVTVTVASGSITATPPSCTILSGQSRCAVALTWTSSHMTAPKVMSQFGELISTSANNSVGVTRLINQGATTFSLSNGAVFHNSFTATASCASGTAWSGTVCVPASGSINSSSCVISAGGSDCSATLQWSTANTGASVTVTGPSPSAAVLRSGANGNTTIPIGYGTNYLDLRLDGVITTTGTYIATCAAGTLWSGTLCGLSGISGDLIVSSNECLIPTGQSSCIVNGTWTTTGATNPSLLNETAGSVLSYDAVRSTPPLGLQVTYPGVRFVLRENSTPIDFENVTARCDVGGVDTVDNTCANPLVMSAVVTGQYYATAGNIAISCSNSNKYSVINTDTGVPVVSNGTYTAGSVKNVSVSQSGNYTVYCIQGTYRSAPVVRYYNGASSIPSPTLVLSASPRTVSKASDATISWSIQHPKSSCTLNAKTICNNSTCNENQRTEEDTINHKITNDYTDTANIQSALTGGVRSILSSLRTIPSDRLNTDWKTEGKKTFNINYSTEFVLSCGDQVSQAVRIQVTRTGEQ